MTADELATALNISRRAVTRYVESGCPYRRIGRGSRAPLDFRLAAVKAWMRRTAHTGDGGRPAAGLEVERDGAESDQDGGKCCRAGCSADSVETFHHDSLTRACADHVEELRPWVGDGDQPKEDLVGLTRRVNIRIKELEVQRRERLEQEACGMLVPLAEVRRAWSTQVEVVQARFRALPSSLAQRLVDKSYEQMHDLIDEELRGVLVAFAKETLL